MLEGLLRLFSSRPLRATLTDVVDVTVVAFLVYRTLLVVRGTRAAQMASGLALLLVAYLASKYFGLVTLFNVLSTVWSSIVLVVIVVFQNDIRRALMRIGMGRGFLPGTGTHRIEFLVDEVVAASTELARHRIGAIVCFEVDANIEEFVASPGISLDAAVGRELLVSLFVPEGANRLHDGAVLLRNGRLARAGLFFPMPEGKGGMDTSWGTRHRAALGITEETDAVVVVVSEERGTISLCRGGMLSPDLDGPALRAGLIYALTGKGPAKHVQTARSAEPAPRRVPTSPGLIPATLITIPPPRFVQPTATLAEARRVIESHEPQHERSVMEPDTQPMEPATREPPKFGGGER